MNAFWKRKRLGKLVINIFLMLMSLCIGVIFIEVIVRKFVTISSFRYISENKLHWNSDHPERRFALTPGYRGRLVSQEFNTSVFVNDLGFRYSGNFPSDNPSSINNVKDLVFVIGDSYVFGVGVDYENSIPARLEHYLNEQNISDLSVWNLGVPGYAVQQSIFTLHDFVSIRKPDQVVMCVFTSKLPSGANDITGSVDFENWLLRTGDFDSKRTTIEEKVVENNVSQTNKQKTRRKRPLTRKAIKWLERNSALYNFLMLRVGPIIRSNVHRLTPISEDIEEKFIQGWELVDQYLGYLNRLKNENQFDVMLVYIPEHSDVMINREEF